MEMNIKIKLKIAKDKTIDLTMEEAKEVYDGLKTLFEKEKEYVVSPYNPYNYKYPTITNYPYLTVPCNTVTGNSLTYVNGENELVSTYVSIQ
jgi:hypothetical protein